MSNYGLALVAKSISEVGNLNQENQFITCDQAVNDVSAYCKLTTSWSETLNNDEYECFVDTMSVGPSNPQEAAAAAQAHAQYNADSSTMNKETGNLETQIQNLEAQLQREGNFMQTVYQLQSPINGLEGTLTQLLSQRF